MVYAFFHEYNDSHFNRDNCYYFTKINALGLVTGNREAWDMVVLNPNVRFKQIMAPFGVNKIILLGSETNKS